MPDSVAVLQALQHEGWGLSTAQCKAEEVAAKEGAIEARIFSKDDVAEHNCAETGIWVSYKVHSRCPARPTASEAVAVPPTPALNAAMYPPG